MKSNPVRLQTTDFLNLLILLKNQFKSCTVVVYLTLLAAKCFDGFHVSCHISLECAVL